MEKITIGILGIQGSREEHEKMLKKLKCNVKWVRTPDQLSGINGLIIPGGESTAIGKIIKKNGLYDKLLRQVKSGLPVWGTCAGAILLAINGSPYSLKLIDIDIERNAYGRQNESFITDINFQDKPFKAVFIRAPKITKTAKNVKILARHAQDPIIVRQDNIMASTFHPELTNDIAIHKYFLEKCIKPKH
jgi:5'-phosphate synthase pdxT subunit